MSRLATYLARLETILLRRSDITIESLNTRITPQGASFLAEVRFFDGSRLSIGEQLQDVSRRSPKRLRYRFHYQSLDEELSFRYDDKPHFPNLRTHPHHKHTNRDVVESQPPDLVDVLAEIDQLLYGTT